MKHIITIETQSDNDFALLKSLAQRLGLDFQESHSEDNPLEAQQEAAFKKFVGSWQGEETGDELNAMIYNFRHDSPREIEL